MDFAVTMPSGLVPQGGPDLRNALGVDPIEPAIAHEAGKHLEGFVLSRQSREQVVRRPVHPIRPTAPTLTRLLNTGMPIGWGMAAHIDYSEVEK